MIIISAPACNQQQFAIRVQPMFVNIMLLFFIAFLKDVWCHNCVTHACEAHNIRHCMIELSSVLLDANNNNKGKVRQPVTVTLYVTAEGEET